MKHKQAHSTAKRRKSLHNKLKKNQHQKNQVNQWDDELESGVHQLSKLLIRFVRFNACLIISLKPSEIIATNKASTAIMARNFPLNEILKEN